MCVGVFDAFITIESVAVVEYFGVGREGDGTRDTGEASSVVDSVENGDDFTFDVLAATRALPT